MSQSPDFYCAYCDTFHFGTCDGCGGPHERRCDVCRRRMLIDGPAPTGDVRCSARCARDAKAATA